MGGPPWFSAAHLQPLERSMFFCSVSTRRAKEQIRLQISDLLQLWLLASIDLPGEGFGSSSRSDDREAGTHPSAGTEGKSRSSTRSTHTCPDRSVREKGTYIQRKYQGERNVCGGSSYTTLKAGRNTATSSPVTGQSVTIKAFSDKLMVTASIPPAPSLETLQRS